tara:strand:- start:325 stop:516 length:192 start_codon:yes stop_codon:yes gene_type:complete
MFYVHKKLAIVCLIKNLNVSEKGVKLMQHINRFKQVACLKNHATNDAVKAAGLPSCSLIFPCV